MTGEGRKAAIAAIVLVTLIGLVLAAYYVLGFEAAILVLGTMLVVEISGLKPK